MSWRFAALTVLVVVLSASMIEAQGAESFGGEGPAGGPPLGQATYHRANMRRLVTFRLGEDFYIGDQQWRVVAIYPAGGCRVREADGCC